METRGKEDDLRDVQRVLAGDVEAFEGIVLRWQGPLVNMAYRYCRNRSRAEEWAQEAFLRAFRFLDRWRQDGAFSTWLFALAANVYRSRARRHRPIEVPLEQDRSSVSPAGQAERIEKEEREEMVRRAVCCLPAKYRDVLALFYFHDLDVSEVGKVLGLPEGTVKARLHRGRAQLKARLEKSIGPGR
jgi:RNA polymerase sigma-70 factor (ECF subfamily)